MSESKVVAEVRLALSTGPVRLFRNNVGALQDKHGQWVTYGLCVGSSDLIGFKAVNITPDMVGSTVAVFVALEGKTPRGHVTNEQTAFITTVKTMGGIAGIFRSLDEAADILAGVRK